MEAGTETKRKIISVSSSLELLLIILGLVCLLKAGRELYGYKHFQKIATPNNQLLGGIPESKQPSSIKLSQSVIGQIRISRLQMAVSVLEGDDDEILSIAAGHMRGTASIGSRGNTVIAGHRDTVFWPLQAVKAGDIVTVQADKKYRYSVEQIQIVDPQNTEVLRDTHNAVLTLVTCYPFRHIGPSPKRFIVRAKLIN